MKNSKAQTTEQTEPCSQPADMKEEEQISSSDNPPSGGEEEAVRQDLEKKIEENRALQDKYLRLAAEFDNYKRRARRDQSDGIRFANEKLLKDLLPTIDNLERAIQSGRHQTGEALLEGVELTRKQFIDTLTKLGVQQITSVGEPFDPSRHQAIAQVESDTMPANTVAEEFQKGYFLYERILRPAMVTVAKEPSNQQAQSTTESCSEEEGREA